MIIDVTPIVELKPRSSYGNTLATLEQVMKILRQLTPEEQRRLVLALNALVAP